MKNSLVALGLLPLAFSTVEAQTIYRCTVGSEIRFQQTPCESTSPTVGEDLKRKQAKDALARKNAEEAAVEVRARQERIDSLPDEKLSPLQRAERNSRRADQAFQDVQRKAADGTFARQFQERLDTYCGGKAIDELRLGLTEEQVLNCTVYQRPETVNVTTSAAGTTKQYVYRRYSKPEYLYFRNGILTSMQQ